MKKINFILAIHNHQPVGNFNHVFEEAYQKAYLPFIDILTQHPSIKVALHYSGSLLNWLIDQHPELIGKVRKMVDHGQVEMLTGGYYEPILPIIPDWDKVGQIGALTQKIKEHFNTIPKGMWLAERIWEPSLSKPLSEAKVEFTLVDDAHFKQVGLTEEQLLGHYVTEEQNNTLKLFSISQKLRYLIPFASSTQEVFDYLDSVASEQENRLIMMGDDGEKFGLWPTTYDWVYKKGWLEKFFAGLEERADWIKSVTFSQWLNENRALGRIYLSCGAYAELMEWVLPANSQLIYEELIQKLKDRNEDELYAQFIKGGFFRNFLVKYPEANNMHKKMLYVSEKVDKFLVSPEYTPVPSALSNAQQLLNNARSELWQGQCNCAYWHGVFGGLYLPHLRRAVYEHLIKAENIIDNASQIGGAWLKVNAFDLDSDGEKEVLANTQLVNLYFDPGEGGALFEFDYKPRNYNLLNTLARRKEGYHQKLKLASGPSGKKQAKSIHDQVLTKEKGLEKYLYYDWHKKVCLLDHFLHPQTTLAGFSRAEYAEEGDFVNQPYLTSVKRIRGGVEIDMIREGRVWISGLQQQIEVSKRIVLNEKISGFEAEYLVLSHCKEEVELVFGIEFNFILPSANSPSCYYHFPGTDKNIAIDLEDELDGVKRIMAKDDLSQMEIDFDFGQEATLWCCPIKTVSYSEAGFELGYQGSTILPHWKLSLMPGRFWETKIKMRAF